VKGVAAECEARREPCAAEKRTCPRLARSLACWRVAALVAAAADAVLTLEVRGRAACDSSAAVRAPWLARVWCEGCDRGDGWCEGGAKRISKS